MDLFQNPSSCFSSLKANRRLESGLWIAKVVLMLMGVVSLLVLLKVAIIPYTFHLLLSTLPRLWSDARTSLTLPFVYIILNFIIITIAASSNFSHHYSIPFSHHHHSKKSEDADSDSDTLITTTLSDTPTTNPTQPPAKQEEEQHKEVIEQEKEEEKVVQVVDDDDDGDYDYDKLREFGLSFDKILSSSSSLEKCTNDYLLPDSDDKGDDHDHDGDGDDNTLEATWRAIMEGQGKTMKPQLKKSDTWSAGARISKAEPFQQLNGQGYDGGGHDDDDPVAWAQRELRKSETFNDRASLRREKSMTPEELNLRAEAFIKNFNNQMKLQRLESYQRYIKMVNGRA
ncbi:hypothetical protein PIB30_003570 [Stylosanthes scabra]|uniref:DUF4408 domain-containing protein n=1 Tax=Stylosanthes scabra TaxID=79078 RepID=A0ABU6X1Q7_9FABA|nr:hypothetical protein [Stylosanthes scabra]